MKVLLAKDLQGKSMKDLVALRSKQRKSLFESVISNSVKSLSQTHLIKVAKKNIARINTVIRTKTLQSA